MIRRLTRAKTIDENTPCIVILEMMRSMGYKTEKNPSSPDDYFDRLTIFVNDFVSKGGGDSIDIDPVSLFPTSTSEINLSNAARYVNADSSTIWPVENLNKAFFHLMTFDPSNIDVDFRIGKKTPECPNNYDACMLYEVCRNRELSTNRNMDLTDMENLIRGKNGEEPLEGICNDFFNSDMRKVFFKRFVPISRNEIIAFVLCKYGLNIYYASDLTGEYEYIQGLNSLEHYIPRDKKLLKLFKRDRRWIRHNDKFWTPQLLESYSNISLHDMAEDEGITDGDLQDPKAALRSLSDSTHIYIGIHPMYSGKMETYTQYNIKSYDDAQLCGDIIMTIGKTGSPKSLFLITLSELVSHFSSTCMFLVPDDRNYYFSWSAINKLKRYCEREIENMAEIGTSIIDKPVTNMKNIISNIEIMDNGLGKHIEKINRLSNFDKNHIRKYLTYILELAYYMRGWKVDGNEAPPLRSENTLTSENSFKEVEKNYNEQFCRVNDFYNTLIPEITDIIDGILLVTIKNCDGETLFTNVNNPEVGKTLMDKLIIITQNDNDNACIRLSSNYILYTVYYYYRECFDGEELFDVREVGTIS